MISFTRHFITNMCVVLCERFDYGFWEFIKSLSRLCHWTLSKVALLECLSINIPTMTFSGTECQCIYVLHSISQYHSRKSKREFQESTAKAKETSIFLRRFLFHFLYFCTHLFHLFLNNFQLIFKDIWSKSGKLEVFFCCYCLCCWLIVAYC